MPQLEKKMQLEEKIKSGGEGIIYTITGNSDLVVKVYKDPNRGYENKLRCMLDNPPVNSNTNKHISIAWPQGLAYSHKPPSEVTEGDTISLQQDNKADHFIGYVMLRVHDSLHLLTVYNPRLRAKHCPDFTGPYLCQTACNIALVMAALHDKGYCIGDVNSQNILVTRTALVTFIDTDSFQVTEPGGTVYRCQVGKPDYTAPEIMGKDLKGLDRTEAHDNFGLGVLIFQLLMEGSHPFRSKWLGTGEKPSLTESIRQGLFPYNQPQSFPVEPPQGKTLDDLPRDVVALMESCFIRGHDYPDERPSARDWANALSEAEKQSPKPSGAKRWWPAVAVVLVLGFLTLGGLGGWYVFQDRRNNEVVLEDLKELETFEKARDAGLQALKAYIEQYPNSPYISRAKDMIQTLEEQGVD
ncbi:MAG: protein kinase [Candidatus Latescibacteria bacterium]|nr:protein kinase [Candidatus Latescibacterota bacterium]